MTFLNQVLVWGGLAFSIPLIIHLLNRSRYRTIDWGAMHLLESVLKVNHRKLRIEQLILLLVRCSIPILLALCLARPVLTGSAALEGEAPVSIVVVIDDSYSMDTIEDGTSRFDKAIEEATKIIDNTRRGSEIVVLMSGTEPTPLFDGPVFDSETVIRKLAEKRGGMGRSDFGGVLEKGLTTLEKMSHARRELVILSDFQNRDWQERERWGEMIRQHINTSNIPLHVTMLPLGDTTTDNLSVEALEYSRRAIGVDQLLNVRAQLRNWGTSDAGVARVNLNIDGQTISQSQIDIPASSTAQILFPCRFDSPGSHVIEVQLVEDDSLLTDNSRKASIDVWNKIDVVLVDGAPSNQPLQGETDYMAIALTPLTLGRLPLADLVQTRTIETPSLTEETLSNARVVVLANVARLDETQLSLLKAFVSNGGTLLEFVGDRIDLNWYNQSLFEAGLLPAKLGKMKGNSPAVNEQSSTGGSTKIVVQNFDHPALAPFNDPSQGDLSSADIRRWYSLFGFDSARSSDAEGLSVLAWLSSGDPLLIERRLGQGSVLLMTTPCDADWSDFPLKPVFVPFVQQLVTTLAANATPPRNITTGETAIAILEEQTSNPLASTAEQVVLQLPTGVQQTLPIQRENDRGLVRITKTQRPGTYELNTPSGEIVHFVASTTGQESDPVLIDRQRLTDWSENIGGTVVKSADEYLALDAVRRNGREIWKYLLFALLGIMFFEIFLQQRFAGVRT